ncbi:hypothetical protein SAMN05444414_102201 [Roseovarius marisflavi]|uniref:Uncharacterized protein n=1 Tax=Roseovarius marisflavi TaxID=1054996 RepID=A0A1M6W9S6_9RHOB|nr:hypothetical protein SAMN05444414_102201 [Roseovarius marisflavi]
MNVSGLRATDPTFQPLHRRLDVRAALVRVSRNHGQGLMAGNTLYRWQVHTGLDQMCYRCMT